MGILKSLLSLFQSKKKRTSPPKSTSNKHQRQQEGYSHIVWPSQSDRIDAIKAESIRWGKQQAQALVDNGQLAHDQSPDLLPQELAIKAKFKASQALNNDIAHLTYIAEQKKCENTAHGAVVEYYHDPDIYKEREYRKCMEREALSVQHNNTVNARELAPLQKELEQKEKECTMHTDLRNKSAKALGIHKASAPQPLYGFLFVASFIILALGESVLTHAAFTIFEGVPLFEIGVVVAVTISVLIFGKIGGQYHAKKHHKRYRKHAFLLLGVGCVVSACLGYMRALYIDTQPLIEGEAPTQSLGIFTYLASIFFGLTTFLSTYYISFHWSRPEYTHKKNHRRATRTLKRINKRILALTKKISAMQIKHAEALQPIMEAHLKEKHEVDFIGQKLEEVYNREYAELQKFKNVHKAYTEYAQAAYEEAIYTARAVYYSGDISGDRPPHWETPLGYLCVDSKNQMGFHKRPDVDLLKEDAEAIYKSLKQTS